jgi:thiopurine S-methyltransferase
VAGLTLFHPFSPNLDARPWNRVFWHERWERSEIGFHQQDINVHLQQFWTQLDLRPGQRVFAPLCGKSRDLLWLAGEGHPVTGVEISRLAVEAFFHRERAEAAPLAGRSVRDLGSR